MKKLKASFLVGVVAVGMSGCGLKMIKKADAQSAANQIYGAIDSARDSACAPETGTQLDKAKALVDALIENYLK